MEWMDKLFMGLSLVLATMWCVKKICEMNMFKEWGMTKHFVLIVGLLISSFYFKYFLMCYGGIDESMMWVRLLGNEIVFPRCLIVFVIVNLILPGVLILFFRTLEGEDSFLQCSYGATSCIALAGFSWHFIYMYPEVDESIALFTAFTITVMIIYAYRNAMKRELVTQPQKWVEIIGFVAGFVLFFGVATRYMVHSFNRFYVQFSFKNTVLSVLFVVGYWYIWNLCESFSRRVFALPAAIMPSLRWGYAFLMNLGVVPHMDYFVGSPFEGRFVIYDLMCLAILSVCMLWNEKERRMLRVRTPIDKVEMVIRAETLAEIIDKKTCESEKAKLQMKRFFFATAEEVDGYCGWIQFISYVYRNGLVEAVEDNREEIVMRTKSGDDYIYLIGETKEALEEAREWLERFMEKEALNFSNYILPRNLFF